MRLRLVDGKWLMVDGKWLMACHVKCDACPVCPVRKYDCIGVKFEVRKCYIREGAYFTVVDGKWLMVNG